MHKILVAEDHPASRELIEELLQGFGYDVVSACDGQDALAKVEDHRPDLVVMDIQMPVLDGFAVLHRLREDTRFARLPIVALSAYAMRGDRQKGLSAGFDAYLTKPIDSAALKEQIDSLLRRQNL
jgi:CheY-like chemotaxis protein